MSLALWARAAMAGAAMADDELGQSFPLGTRSENAQGLTITMRNQAGDRLIDPKLVAGGGTAYLIDIQIGLFAGNYSRLRLGTATTESGRSAVSGPDLTSQFEGNWEITLRLGNDTWEFDHTEFGADTSEPYSWLTSDSAVQTRLKEARDALRNTSGGTVTLHDGATVQSVTQRFNIGARTLISNNQLRMALAQPDSNQLVIPELVQGGGVAYFNTIELHAKGFRSNPPDGPTIRITLGSSASYSTTPSGVAGPDFTDQFERNWNITVSDGTNSWDFTKSNFNLDDSEPYVWVSTRSLDVLPMQAAIDNLKDSSIGYVILDDGSSG